MIVTTDEYLKSVERKLAVRTFLLLASVIIMIASVVAACLVGQSLHAEGRAQAIAEYEKVLLQRDWAYYDQRTGEFRVVHRMRAALAEINEKPLPTGVTE